MMNNTQIFLSPNPGLTYNQLLKILKSHKSITPEAIADVISANNQRLALQINTCLQRINPPYS